MLIPSRLRATCIGIPEGQAWLDELPRIVSELQSRWSLTLGPPLDGEDVTCSWLAPAASADGTPAILKVGLPHFEGAHEIDGLRFWNGNPTVRLLDADDARNAMLLERCEPGTSLRERPENEQDVVIAGLLRRMWQAPAASHTFRPLSFMIAYWSEEVRARESDWLDAGLVRDGLEAFDTLIREPMGEQVVLATDLHAGNVLRAQRDPWLVIDPKPFVGERAYDATQHLLNCPSRLHQDPLGTVRRFADLLGVDAGRVRRWLFARAAAGPSSSNDVSTALARKLA